MRGDRSRFKSEFLLGRGKYRLTVTLTLTLIFFSRWILQTGNYVGAIEFTVLCFQENLTILKIKSIKQEDTATLHVI